jgi:hypothetical protein
MVESMKHRTAKAVYETLNARNFGGVLEMPAILFTRNTRVHGEQNTGFIKLNFTDIRGMSAKVETIYHEMVHQYIDEYLDIDLWETDYHGSKFIKQYNKFSFGIVKDSDYALPRTQR